MRLGAQPALDNKQQIWDR